MQIFLFAAANNFVFADIFVFKREDGREKEMSQRWKGQGGKNKEVTDSPMLTREKESRESSLEEKKVEKRGAREKIERRTIALKKRVNARREIVDACEKESAKRLEELHVLAK